MITVVEVRKKNRQKYDFQYYLIQNFLFGLSVTLSKNAVIEPLLWEEFSFSFISF